MARVFGNGKVIQSFRLLPRGHLSFSELWIVDLSTRISRTTARIRPLQVQHAGASRQSSDFVFLLKNINTERREALIPVETFTGRIRAVVREIRVETSMTPRRAKAS